MNLLAALGLAIAHYNDKDAAQDGMQGIRRARKLFGKVLAQYPACPPDVRLGFGLCCYRLGEMDRARAAFQRCVASRVDVECVLAMSCMGLLTESPTPEYMTTKDAGHGPGEQDGAAGAGPDGAGGGGPEGLPPDAGPRRAVRVD